MGKGGSQTTGYRYFMSMGMGLCRGPINEIVAVKVGDEFVWGDGGESDEDTLYINSPWIFGGDKKEGGVMGPLTVKMGKADQEAGSMRILAELKSTVASAATTVLSAMSYILGVPRVPGMRGVVTAWFDGYLCANNPYPKTWAFRLRRSDEGWFNDNPWYPEKALIQLSAGAIHAMNAAHIIYECSTNKEWGKGEDPSALDEDSFILTANTLCNEGFGLCFFWSRQDDIDEFIKTVINHVGASYYTDRETGKMCLRLIRNDYVVDDLPLFEPGSGLLDVEEDQSASGSTAYNEVIVKYRNPVTNKDESVRAENPASFAAIGEHISTTVDYPGLPTKELGSRVAERELGIQASNLRKYRVRLDRRAWRLYPGAVFRIRDLSKGIGMTILRVGEVNDGTLDNGAIEVFAMQDVFGMPTTSYVKPQPPTWVAPSTEALPSPAVHLEEMTFREVSRLASDEITFLDPENNSALEAMAARPTSAALNYALYTKAAGEEYVNVGEFDWAPTAILSEALSKWGSVVRVHEQTGIDSDVVGTVALIGAEQVLVTAIEYESDGVVKLTVGRGAVDTVPVAHATGDRVWFPQDNQGLDYREYVYGDVASARFQTRTYSSILPEEDSPEESLAFNRRYIRPYPPAFIRAGASTETLADVRSVSSVTGPLVLDWRHRNRLTQLDKVLSYDFEDGMGSLTPEDGTTYTIRFLNGATVVRTITDIAGNTYTYSEVDSDADGWVSPLRVQIEAVRDGFVSWQAQDFTLNHIEP